MLSPGTFIFSAIKGLIPLSSREKTVMHKALVILSGVILASIGGLPLQAFAAAQTAQVLDPRMDMVIKLINSSSGARQVMNSENSLAHEHHAKARKLYAQALEADNQSEAVALLDDAIQSMFAAVRSASPDAVLADKKKRDFDKLKRSIDAFSEQHKRISDEKGAAGDSEALRSQADRLVAEAETLFDAGHPDNGQQMLRDAFEMLRNSIEGMRGGDTLVRSLSFADKEEEYQYELERYKSQRLLVNLLLEDKLKGSKDVADRVNTLVRGADDEKEQAKVQAAEDKHDEAVKTLEHASKQIVRAIRSGGIYIPG
jgi:hypothetical protein